MRYRIALCGFSDFEYRAMHFSFQHPAGQSDSKYDVVDALSDADFAVVDADSSSAIHGVAQSGKLAQTVFVGASAPAGAASHLRRPIDTNRILRALDELSGQGRSTAPAKGPLPGVDRRKVPLLEDVVIAPDSQFEEEVPTQPSALMPEADLAPPAEPRPPTHAQAKAAARAAARHARLANTHAAQPDIEPLRDVLVLDSDPAASGQLCTLLERFGFRADPVATLEQAADHLTAHTFAAMFLDMALDDDGIALLQQIRALDAPTGHPPPVVFMVTARLDPADRVRAALAGVGEPLVKPLQRGVVARALENKRVTLPADARRT
jgi:CheY-like chemotaxis protein